MSEVARLWGPETAVRTSSTEDSPEPIALEARLAEARARRTQVLATKSGTPAPIPPPAARAFPHAPPPFLASLAAGAIAAALGVLWIAGPFAAPSPVASAPEAITVPPAVPAQPAAGDFRRGARTVAPVAPTDFPRAPALAAPSREAVDAALVDEGPRPLSAVRTPGRNEPV